MLQSSIGVYFFSMDHLFRMHSIANDIRSGEKGGHINGLNLKQIEF